MSLSVNRISAYNSMPVQSFGSKRSYAQYSENNQSSTNTMAYLGVLGVGLLAAVLAFKKGKVLGEISTLKRMDSLSLSDFKKVGKFEKGKAIIDEKAFTGTIKTEKTKLTYENGIIKKSELNNGQVKEYFNFENAKSYDFDNKKYSDTIKKTVITNENHFEINKYADGTTKLTREPIPRGVNSVGYYAGPRPRPFIEYQTTVKPDGSIQRIEFKQANISHRNYKNGEEQAIKKITDLDTGKVLEMKSRLPKYSEPVKYKKHLLVDGKKVMAKYENGELQYAHSIEYDCNKGIFTKRFYELNDKGMLVPNGKVTETDKKTRAYLTYQLDKNGNKTDLCLSDPYGGTYNSKLKWYDGSRYTQDINKIKDIIEKLGLKFEI